YEVTAASLPLLVLVVLLLLGRRGNVAAGRLTLGRVRRPRGDLEARLTALAGVARLRPGRRALGAGLLLLAAGVLRLEALRLDAGVMLLRMLRPWAWPRLGGDRRRVRLDRLDQVVVFRRRREADRLGRRQVEGG